MGLACFARNGRKRWRLLIALAGGAVAARGAEALATSADVTLASRYVFRGQAWGGAALQPAVTWSDAAFTGGVWASQPLERADGPETDVYGSYRIATGRAQWDVGATLYHRAPADLAAGRRLTYEPYVAVGTALDSGVAPGAAVYFNPVRDAWTGQAQAAYALPLARWGASLDFAAAAGRTWAPRRGGGSSTFGSAGATLRYQLVRATLSAGAQIAGATRGGAWHTVGLATLGWRYEF